MTTIGWPQLAVLLPGSFVVQVITVMPTGNGALSGFRSLRTAVVINPQLSWVIGTPGLTTAENCPESVYFAMPAGHVIDGDWLSVTVTVKLQLGGVFCVEQFTVVVPTGKVEPDAGRQVITPQLVAVGAG